MGDDDPQGLTNLDPFGSGELTITVRKYLKVMNPDLGLHYSQTCLKRATQK